MKKALMLAVLFTAQLAQAKDYILVVKPQGPHQHGKTEVSNNGGQYTDTLTVIPSKTTESIRVLVSDIDGNLISWDAVPADMPNTYRMNTPTLPQGVILKVKDDEQTVYESYEQ